MKQYPLTEKELVFLSKNGDPQSFEQLLLENQDYLKKWILSMCRGNNALAEEIFQITTIKAWNNIQKFKGDSRFKTWVCSISRNLFIDMKRKTDRRSEVCLDIDLNKESTGEDTRERKEVSIEIDPLIRYKRQELKLFLETVLDKLSRDHSNVLKYFAIDQLSYEEIAKAMQCSVGTVMSRLFYARKKAQKVFYQIKEREDYCDTY